MLAILQKNRLYLKPEKCDFEQEVIEYLGLIISQNKIEVDPIKIAGIKEWPIPKNLKETQSFLGFCNFYRRFIKEYSHIIKPMTRLTGKMQWRWSDEQQKAFERLKEALCTAPCLKILDDIGKFRLEADASEGAVGAVLSQEQEGKMHPIAYFSKSLNDTERNYKIYDKEMLGIMLALDEWRQFLMGARQTFEIWTDHNNLQYFRQPQKVNRRQARWITELANYDYTLHHKPGSLNKKANALSRRPDHDMGKHDNKNQVLLLDQIFRNTAWALEPNVYEPEIVAHKDKVDNSVQKALTYGEKGWKQEGDLVWFEGKLYVPKNKELQIQIICDHHDSALAGHPGPHKTQEMIMHNYYWPRMMDLIRQYVDGCKPCQQDKIDRTARHAPLNPMKAPE